MPRARAIRLRTSAVVAFASALAAAGLACGTLLGTSDDPAAVPPDDDASGRDAVAEQNVGAGDAMPGTDGASADGPADDDGGPITVDASLDGNNPDGCPFAVNCTRVVFVTAAPVNYAVAQDGDMHCTTVARLALLPRIRDRQFQSWTSLSTDGTDPISRFTQSSGPYIRPNGTVIASNWTDLIDGTLQASIFHDQDGNPIGASAGSHVWTGTSAAGTFAGPNCSNWAAPGNARVGVIGSTTTSWSSFVTPDPCSASLRLYCFEK